jgi:hypothetical protein
MIGRINQGIEKDSISRRLSPCEDKTNLSLGGDKGGI